MCVAPTLGTNKMPKTLMRQLKDEGLTTFSGSFNQYIIETLVGDDGVSISTTVVHVRMRCVTSRKPSLSV